MSKYMKDTTFMFWDLPDKSQKLETVSFFTCGSGGFHTMKLSLPLESTSTTVNIDKTDMWSIGFVDQYVNEVKLTTQNVLS